MKQRKNKDYTEQSDIHNRRYAELRCDHRVDSYLVYVTHEIPVGYHKH